MRPEITPTLSSSTTHIVSRSVRVALLDELEAHVRRIVELLGEASDREGLRRTPARVAESLLWLTRGYGEEAAEVVDGALFETPSQSMIIVRDIELYSLCEHHMLPFYGRAHVAYLPGCRIIGLSKIARLVDMFARRLQVQERLTDQIATALDEILQPRGVGVISAALPCRRSTKC